MRTMACAICHRFTKGKVRDGYRAIHSVNAQMIFNIFCCLAVKKAATYHEKPLQLKKNASVFETVGSRFCLSLEVANPASSTLAVVVRILVNP
jgi:hypothetical protein